MFVCVCVCIVKVHWFWYGMNKIMHSLVGHSEQLTALL